MSGIGIGIGIGIGSMVMGGTTILENVELSHIRTVETNEEFSPWYLSGGIPAENCIAAYAAVGAANLEESYVNLANPGTYNLVNGVAPTWAAETGWTFNGTQYKETGITPSSNGETNGWSMFLRFSGFIGSTGYTGMCALDGTYFSIAPNRGETRRYINGTGILSNPGGMEAGVIGMAGGTPYLNGVSDGAINLGTNTKSMIYIGCTGLGPQLPVIGNIQALVIYDSVLTEVQALAISNAMAALPFDVTIPAYPAPIVGDGEFTVVFMTDSHVGTWMTESDIQTTFDYLRDKQTGLNLQAVLYGGDYADSVDHPDDRAAFVSAIGSIEDIPHLVAIGNHDYDYNNGPRNSIVHNGVFGQSYFTGKNWWSGGFFETGHSENSYMLLSIDGIDYIFIALELFPRQAVLEWANALLTAHAAKKAIIITHAYEYTDGTPYSEGDSFGPDGGQEGITDADYHWGNEMWDELIKLHDNVILVHSGHVNPCARHVANSDGGQSVNQVLANYQGDWGDHFFNTLIRYLIFNPTTETIRVESFSAVYRQWYSSPDHKFTLTY